MKRENSRKKNNEKNRVENSKDMMSEQSLTALEDSNMEPSAEMNSDAGVSEELFGEALEQERDLRVGGQEQASDKASSFDPDIYQHVVNRAVLVLMFKNSKGMEVQVQELKSLAEAAGVEVMSVVTQVRDKKTAATYVGKGKAEEVRALVRENGCDVVIFNEELSGSQIRNLEEIVSVRVIDRTLLILDIFAMRAKTNIAKLQVELARQKYKLPRLVGFGGDLSRTGASGGGGGVRVGTRGAGEQKLELDRRAIQKRITELERQVAEAESSHRVQRAQREKNEVPIVALVGYTNAGKSSIMNYFVRETVQGDADAKTVFEKDMLFATLDTYSRKIQFDDKSEILLVDTVGFVSKLPHTLVKAFNTTLEEAALADLLVQVVDSSSDDRDFQMEVTAEVLETIGAGELPIITAYNKSDLMPESFFVQDDALRVSAKTGEGMDALVDLIKEKIFSGRVQTTLLIPFSEGSVQSYLQGKYVTEVEWTERGALLRGKIEKADYEKYKEYELT